MFFYRRIIIIIFLLLFNQYKVQEPLKVEGYGMRLLKIDNSWLETWRIQDYGDWENILSGAWCAK